MLGKNSPRQLQVALLLCALVPSPAIRGQGPLAEGPGSTTETLTYNIEWRLIAAGTAKIQMETRSGPAAGSTLNAQVESAGLVSKLYKVQDVYTSNLDPGFCTTSVSMLSQEGRRKRDTKVTYDRLRRKADYLERDLIKNATVKQDQIDIPNCVTDVVGGLFALRNQRVDIGKSVELPTSDGKKSAQVRIEAQEREEVKIKEKPVKTIRYEAFVMNGVIYARKARVLVWLTDDSRKVPVKIQLRTNFPIGTVTLLLDKEERT